MQKSLFLLIILSLLSSCKSKKTALNVSGKSNSVILSGCPENSTCALEIKNNSALTLTTEPDGKPFYTIIPQNGTTVYRYEMTQNQDQQYMDGGYREEIIFQLPSDFKNGVLSDKELLQTNALFGVFCYCKGKAGYYSIGKGTITKTDQSIRISIPELVEGQKVMEIEFKF